MAQIRYAKIRTISLLARGATQLPILYKGEAMATLEDLGLQSVLTKGEEEGLLTAIVWPVDNADDTGLKAKRLVVQQMAHDAMIDGVNIDLNHDGKLLTKEQAAVVENFIVQAGDPRFVNLKDYSGNPVDAEGAWGTVIKIQDPDIRRLYREGEWNAVSMMGPALVSKAQAATPSTEDTPMNPEQYTELMTLLKGQSEAIAKLEAVNVKKAELVKAAQVKADAEAEAQKTTVIKFEGNPSNAKEVKAHLDAIKLRQLDFTDAEAVTAHLATLTIVKKAAKPDADASDDDSDELILAREQLKKAEAAILKLECGTNQNDEDESESQDITAQGLKKGESEAWAQGKKLAAFCNQPL